MDMFILNQPRVVPRQHVYRLVKRGMDLAICVLALPVVLPVAALSALAIKLDSPGPVILVQERIGKGGRRFRMFKFRTMQHRLDDSSHRVFMKAYVRGEIGGLDKPTGQSAVGRSGTPLPAPRRGSNGHSDAAEPVVFKPAQEQQITRVGRLLRKTSIDEFPQIINVFKNEMSLVGPRPNVPWEVEEYRPWQHERLEVLPGITGLAQVRGRSGLAFVNLVRSDIEYVEKQSLALDVKILWQTLAIVLMRKGVK
jgi:lipopolysaccharide/colanic/teichoic acid biosynthesis glycosyltransferase